MCKFMLLIVFVLLLTNCCSLEVNKMKIKNGYYYGEKFGLPGQAAIFVKIENDKAFVECYNHYYHRVYIFMFDDTLTRNEIDNNKFISQYSVISMKKNKIYYETTYQPINFYKKIPKTHIYLDTVKYNKMYDTVNNKIIKK